MHRYKKLLVGFAVAVATVGLSVLPAAAQAVTRPYTADAGLQRGMIVRLADKDKTKVQPLKADDIKFMEGVVVAANDAPVTLSDGDATKQQVFVATTGRYNVLVSNQNGSVKNGDFITVSSLAGVGMKTGRTQSLIIGKALAGFDGKTNVSGTATLKGTDGKNVSVGVGLIPVDINISRNPLESKNEQKVPTVFLGFLQSAAVAIVKKPVDPARLYLGVLLLLLTMAVAGSILYAGVRSSIVSIGRNPLAKKSIVGNLMQIVLISIIVLIIGLLGVYLLLKL
ncbi:MAG TPA: hypothetical protein VK983_00120 [Candidatus Limnocylindrales bacterium]|nr:hypothetical protein [Candidatus Limnocylindrales bacterium]